MHVYNAYVYASLTEVICMTQSVESVDPEKPSHVCVLTKAFYDHHQNRCE